MPEYSETDYCYRQRQVDMARSMAELYHYGQHDLVGKPYMHHINAVVNHVSDILESSAKPFTIHPLYYDCTIVAYLHDAWEDGPFVEPCSKEIPNTYKIIKGLFGDTIAETIDILTHDNFCEYDTYIDNIAASENLIAGYVKLADLRHNTDSERVEKLFTSVSGEDLNRYQRKQAKYHRAISILEKQCHIRREKPWSL
jgi:(p)ppGpp synthase/HD superfamily hydrolase